MTKYEPKVNMLGIKTKCKRHLAAALEQTSTLVRSARDLYAEAKPLRWGVTHITDKISALAASRQADPYSNQLGFNA